MPWMRVETPPPARRALHNPMNSHGGVWKRRLRRDTLSPRRPRKVKIGLAPSLSWQPAVPATQMTHMARSTRSWCQTQLLTAARFRRRLGDCLRLPAHKFAETGRQGRRRRRYWLVRSRASLRRCPLMLVMPEVGCRISFGCGDCATDCAGCTCFHFAWLCELLNNIYGPMYRSVHVLRVVATHNPVYSSAATQHQQQHAIVGDTRSPTCQHTCQ